MTGFPILDRELRVGCRTWRTPAWRMALTVGGSVTVLGFLGAGKIAGWTPSELGEDLFRVLSLLGLAYSLLAGPVLTTDCLSSEKRQGTLPLLLLSRLPPSNIVFGKLLACSLPAFYALLAFLPLLALPFFLGGTTFGEFWRMAGLLISVLAASLALCGFVSALSWSGRKALAGSTLALLIWAGLPWLWATFGKSMPGANWFPDPVGFWQSAGDENYTKTAALFTRRIVGCWLAFVGFMVAATLIAPRCLDAPLKRPAVPPRWFGSRSACRHSRSREHWFALNPVAWIARRRAPRWTATIVFFVLYGGTALTAAIWSHKVAPQLELFLAFVFCLHGLLKLWLAWEMSRCLSRDQADGLLEPLLAAPLTEHQIVHGWITGLQTVFRWPVIFLLAMDFVIWHTCDLGVWSYALIASMGMVAFDAFTLLWAGLYFGLIARSATRGLLQTIAAVLLAPWLLGLGGLAVLNLVQIDWLVPRSGLTLCVLWLAVGSLVNAALCFHCSRRLGEGFRHLVAERS